MHDFYGKGKEDSFQRKTVPADALHDTQHAFYWSLAFLKVMLLNKKQPSHKNTRGGKNLQSPKFTYLMHKNMKQENN